MQYRSRWLIVAALLAALAACNKAENTPQAAPAPAAPPPPPVSVATVIAREVSDAEEFSGRLEAVERVDIRPRVSGYIQSIHFKEGSEIKKGDTLFIIDPRPYQAELRRVQAELESARSRAELSKSQLNRSEKLVKDRFIAREAYDEKASEHRAALAAIRAAQAAVEQVQLNVEFTRVRSPISGRVGRAEVTLGNLVNSGPPDGTLLTTVVSLDPIYAYFEGDEQVYLKHVGNARAAAGNAAPRSAIYMGLANEQGFPHQGYVDFIDNHLDPATGTIRARAVFDNKSRLLTPGLFARLQLVSSGAYPAILINDRAVGTDQSQKFVLVVGAGNKADYRAVKLGPIIDGLRVVREGLQAGEKIVVNGLQRVRPGTPVTPQMVPMQGEPTKPAAGAAAPQS